MVTTLLLGLACQAGPTLALTDIHLRDPFILRHETDGAYYLFGTGWSLGEGPGCMAYRSRDLVRWEGPEAAFRRPEGFWADRDYWAPEVHAYRGRYYLFGSLKSEDARRGTQILVADHPAGPYAPHSDGPVTPRDWECLDGTLYVDEDGRPWLVFCHEWLQVQAGEMCAIPLTEDLRKAAGPPQLLFRASEAPWIRALGDADSGNYITDGPFMIRGQGGELFMLWASFSDGGYAQAYAVSRSGALAGPWEQAVEPLYRDDGGHAMVFTGPDGARILALHQPNGGAAERPRLFRFIERDGALAIEPWSVARTTEADEG